jgi:hypothetical protein
MRSLLARAVNPDLSLPDALHDWNSIASSLRERPRKRRYQHEQLDDLLS